MNLPSLSGGLQWDQSQFGSQGILSIINPIPEPSAVLLFLIGGGIVASRIRNLG